MINNLTKYLESEDLFCFPEQVFQVALSVQEAREILDGNEVSDFDSTLDEAQGSAFTRKEPVYLIIKITP